MRLTCTGLIFTSRSEHSSPITVIANRFSFRLSNEANIQLVWYKNKRTLDPIASTFHSHL